MRASHHDMTMVNKSFLISTGPYDTTSEHSYVWLQLEFELSAFHSAPFWDFHLAMDQGQLVHACQVTIYGVDPC